MSPGDHQPKRKLERFFGIAALICSGPWMFQGVIKVLDWISRGQTAVTIMPYLGLLSTPVAFLVEFALGVIFLLWATKLERVREAFDAPRVILAYTEAEPPKHKSGWLKSAGLVAMLFVVIAFASWAWVKRIHRQRIASRAQEPIARTDAPQPTPAKSPEKTNPPGKTKLEAKAPKAGGGNGDQSPPKPPVIEIPTSERPSTPLDRKEIGTITATINGVRVSATEKPEGTVYVSIRLSDLNAYRGQFNDKTIEAVRTKLEATKKVRVFLGQYTVGTTTGTRTYGVGGIGSQAKTIYYPDKALAAACASIKAVVSDVIGVSVDCLHSELGRSTPSQINFLADFFIASGMDMEIVL